MGSAYEKLLKRGTDITDEYDELVKRGKDVTKKRGKKPKLSSLDDVPQDVPATLREQEPLMMTGQSPEGDPTYQVKPQEQELEPFRAPEVDYGDRLFMAAHGATLSGMDEIADMFDKETGDKIRERVKRLREEKPLESVVSELIGGLGATGPLAAGAKAIPYAGRTLAPLIEGGQALKGKAVKETAKTALAGGAQGYMETTPEQSAEEQLMQTGMGMAGGTVGQAATSLVSKALPKANLLRTRFMDPKKADLERQLQSRGPQREYTHPVPLFDDPVEITKDLEKTGLFRGGKNVEFDLKSLKFIPKGSKAAAWRKELEFSGLPNREEALTRVSHAKELVGSELDDTLSAKTTMGEHIAMAGSGQKPLIRKKDDIINDVDLQNRLNDSVMGTSDRVTRDDIFKKELENLSNNISEHGMNIKELNDLKRSYQNDVGDYFKNPTPELADNVAAKRIIATRLKEMVSELAGEVGPEFRKKINDLNNLESRMISASKSLSPNVARTQLEGEMLGGIPVGKSNVAAKAAGGVMNAALGEQNLLMRAGIREGAEQLPGSGQILSRLSGRAAGELNIEEQAEQDLAYIKEHKIPRSSEGILAMKDKILNVIAVYMPTMLQVASDALDSPEDQEGIREFAVMMDSQMPGILRKDPYKRIDGTITDPQAKMKHDRDIINDSELSWTEKIALLSDSNQSEISEYEPPHLRDRA